jgi:hypothetical protein
MPEVEMLCLANSRKLIGRCVAGIRTDGRGWIRPVRDSPDGVLFPQDYDLGDRNDAALLDVLRIPVSEPRPELHQPENWLLAPGRWQLVRRIPAPLAMPLLRRALTPGPGLFEDRYDRVPYELFLDRPASASLTLIEPRTVQWQIRTGRRGNRQTRAIFALRGQVYNLSVTDPLFEEQTLQLGEGIHPCTAAGIAASDRLLFTISLGEPFPRTGDCFKLVAAVLVVPPAPPRLRP